ncbi:signal recognition particle receptor alpha subunit, putative [Plasmodium berghei]|uniref:Signal recognition particle receptor subunit alpha, putative n=2 Tax=Plasmodium berghei TaxID=5821 RepID=A0A509AN06_PLABA|nr:signal recognition particle receptor subunit alpha, putative [Plasmodium berghei ANKA]CXI69331.1 signal recognition particle receptor alpha subunit, putative [Plasmodium berghei]SCM24231.1 signal recognition particle receptor alpha subunit, putative [Plasmodium berghei]SCN27013.1 signal recognition particle receptor alpha subunit, putative [Plasmodium berghei]SCO61458.1 signal recognition particle receptor alpha subunit, putative [Plasmodium berghei]SCO63436.1 signal recognition particle re|eukprot:XP_034422630.1 signal recognition particle receptor subunit alpha, putative [Plasmodium berghei ANKA]
MIDVVNVFNKGGVVLWSYNFYEIEENIIRAIIKIGLIEGKYEEFSNKYNKYYSKWKFVNDLDMVILIVYQGIQNSAYLDNLFNKIKKQFVKLIPKNFNFFEHNLPINFDKQFLKILEESDKAMQKSSPDFGNKNNLNNNNTNSNGENNKSEKGEGDEENNSDTNKSTSGKCENKKSKTKKNAREWELNKKITKKDIEKLDYSSKSENKNNSNEIVKYEGEFDDSSDSSITENKNNIMSQLNDSILKMFLSNNTIEESDIEKILQEIKTKLLSKNVASEICDILIERMKEKLIGKKKTMFSLNVKKTVSTIFSDTLQSILIPKDSVDVLRSALEAKSLGKLYSICFLGVNGVGKSTNLAKVCYYLKTKGNLKIMIAACDTFRAGAIEQLRIHAKCLDVYLFEKGYGKNAAAIAKDAISYAKKEKYDVILIDTAGRMQDNEPLMRSLGKLILINNPDLILFVGEALVGNDAIDQLKKFNQTLIDATCDTHKRTIDGILLTKFDTVDDKVGTALSMVYLTGRPIVFVGVGQKYTHLKKFNVNMVVKALS